jgi:hypothetical protein
MIIITTSVTTNINAISRCLFSAFIVDPFHTFIPEVDRAGGVLEVVIFHHKPLAFFIGAEDGAGVIVGPMHNRVLATFRTG